MNLRLRLFLFLFIAFMALASREPPWGDAHVVYDTTQALIDRGHLDVNLGGPPQFYSVRNGKKYGVFPLGNVIAMVPSYLAYRAVRLVPHKPAVEQLLFNLLCHISTSLLIAGTCILFFTLARREGATERVAFWLSLLLGFGSILLVYARAPFSEALQTLAFTWVVERGLTVGDRLTRRGALFLGIACGLLFNTKLVYAIAIVVVPVYLVIRHRRRLGELVACGLVAAVPLCLLVALAIAHNWMKTGTIADTGYRIPDGVFSGDLYAALFGFFLSTGKSIFLYSPPLVLGALAFPDWFRKNRAHAGFVLAITGVATLVNAKFRYWHADYCWGPRLLVPFTAVWLLPAAGWIEGALDRGRTRLRAISVGALVGVAIWVQVLGAAFYWDHYIRIAIAVKDQTGASGWYTEDLHHCHFIPQFSPLVGHAWMLRHMAHFQPGADWTTDAPWRRVIGTKVNLANETGGVRLDWWGLDWIPQKDARKWFGGVAGLLAAGLAATAMSLRRRPEDDEEAERPYRIQGLSGR